jgi:tRNA-splicing ligase RtcB (3'-phosphate/5'-hydroxy nucleic acid ligase)
MTNNIFGVHDEVTIEQFRDVESRAVKAALMPDGHKGYVMPIGGVAAYHNQVSVMGVGVDIGCGNCAVKLDAKIDDIAQGEKVGLMLEFIADDINKTISFGMGRPKNRADDAPIDHPLFDSDAWKVLEAVAGHSAAKKMYDHAKAQLGTVGGGNHYVDVFTDEEGYVWVGDHFGSRGLGHGIASGFNALAAGKNWSDRVPEAEGLLSLDVEMGQAYWELMTLAGQYAFAGREWVARKVAEIIGGEIIDMVHNNHNFAWIERHYTNGFNPLAEDNGVETLIVVRKGATPAFPGQRGFVGGSMGDTSVILKGREYGSVFAPRFAIQQEALFSTVHGAGRVMSRMQAKGKTNWKTGLLKTDGEGKPIRPGLVSQEMMDEWLARVGVIRRGGEVDESPHVYRRLPDVLKYMEQNVEIEHTLTPRIVVMADKNIKDPFKD